MQSRPATTKSDALPCLPIPVSPRPAPRTPNPTQSPPMPPNGHPPCSIPVQWLVGTGWKDRTIKQNNECNPVLQPRSPTLSPASPSPSRHDPSREPQPPCSIPVQWLVGTGWKDRTIKQHNECNPVHLGLARSPNLRRLPTSTHTQNRLFAHPQNSSIFPFRNSPFCRYRRVERAHSLSSLYSYLPISKG
jgi:hypothetical protein